MVNPTTGRVIADPRVNLKGNPPHIATGEGAVWTYGASAETLYRIDPRTMKPEPLGLGITPTDIAAGKGQVWVVDGWDQVLMRIDAHSPTETEKISLPGHANLTLRQSGGTSVAVGRSLIWVAQNNCVCPSLLGVSPTDLRIAARPPILTGGPIATQGTALWLQTSQYPPVITELHPGNPRRITIPRDAAGCCLALTNGAAWYGAGLRVWKIAASVPLVNTDTIHLPANVDGFATGAGKLWVATDTAVVAIDPQTDTKSASVHLALPPSGIAYYLGKLWLTIV